MRYLRIVVPAQPLLMAGWPFVTRATSACCGAVVAGTVLVAIRSPIRPAPRRRPAPDAAPEADPLANQGERRV